MRTIACIVSLVALAACGSSTAPSSGGADVVIVGVSGNQVSVTNIGRAGEFYIESWDQATYNAPGGDSPTLIHLGNSPVIQAPAGYSGTVGVYSGKRYVAKTRVPNGTAYFTSSCYGSC